MEVGRGGFGIVYKAWQPQFQRYVAIKVPNSFSPDDKTLRAFEREAAAMGSLSDSRYVVVPYGSGVLEEGTPFLLLPWLDGGSLQDRINEGPLSWTEGLAIAVRVAAALEDAHAKGVLHLDVKPENVLFTGRGEPQLADFGIAKLESITRLRTESQAFTVLYAAPELLAGDAATGIADVYALAATLYASLNGEPAFFRSATEPAYLVQNRVINEPLVALGTGVVPNEVWRVIERAMRKRPEDRHQSAGEFRRALLSTQRQPGIEVVRLQPNAAAPKRQPQPPRPSRPDSARSEPAIDDSGPTAESQSPGGDPANGHPGAPHEGARRTRVGGSQNNPGPPGGDPANSHPGAPHEGARRTRVGGSQNNPGPPGGESLPVPNRRFVWRATVVILALAGVVALVAGAVIYFGKSPPSGGEVLREPAGSVGPDPFTDSVAGTTREVTATTLVEVGTSASDVGTVRGSADGLYGGTLDQAECDSDRLVAFLEDNPNKAAAWASVQGIDPSAIAGFVDGLTPVLLRQDTRVTNHGYRDGRAVPRQTVFQAGTAVLVDELGVPRARCACGNPLTEPEPTAAAPTFTGTEWPSFDATTIIVVVQATTTIAQFTLVDIDTGDTFARPAGTTGDDDQPISPSPDPEPPPTQVDWVNGAHDISGCQGAFGDRVPIETLEAAMFEGYNNDSGGQSPVTYGESVLGADDHASLQAVDLGDDRPGLLLFACYGKDSTAGFARLVRPGASPPGAVEVLDQSELESGDEGSGWVPGVENGVPSDFVDQLPAISDADAYWTSNSLGAMYGQSAVAAPYVSVTLYRLVESPPTDPSAGSSGWVLNRDPLTYDVSFDESPAEWPTWSESCATAYDALLDPDGALPQSGLFRQDVEGGMLIWGLLTPQGQPHCLTGVTTDDPALTESFEAVRTG